MADDGEDFENFVFPPPPPYYKHFTARNLERLKEFNAVSSTEGNVGGSTSGASTLLALPPELRYLVPPEPPEDGVVRNFGEVKTV
jgi:mediator of RNA polymerase II transcription subunit 7